MERSKERNILLEYNETANHFHYNMDARQRPIEVYHPLGWCTWEEACAFCEIMQPLISYQKNGEILVTKERMKKSWDAFCEMIEKGKISIK